MELWRRLTQALATATGLAAVLCTECQCATAHVGICAMKGNEQFKKYKNSVSECVPWVRTVASIFCHKNTIANMSQHDSDAGY